MHALEWLGCVGITLDFCSFEKKYRESESFAFLRIAVRFPGQLGIPKFDFIFLHQATRLQDLEPQGTPLFHVNGRFQGVACQR